MKPICLLLVGLVSISLTSGYKRGYNFGLGAGRAATGRFYRGGYGDATGSEVSGYDYDLEGDLSGSGSSAHAGRFGKQKHEEDDGFYTQGGSFYMSGKARRDDGYGITAGLKAKGNFYGTGTEGEGSQYEHVTTFRRGGGHDTKGKKKHYNEYDSYGQAKKYADKKVANNFNLRGILRAKGKFDGYGKSDVSSEFDQYGKYGYSGSSKGYGGREVYGKLKGKSEYDAYGKLKGYGAQNDYSKYGRHADYDSLGY
ncbi:hypothetical protein CRM22_010380 [Opisthorchis felineus]|uniref:Trematode Eggshell Synthesis n=1 Tax=Opisthorchis felineus TaxID=147828 RepID=A0A4S2KYQ8_OPIFE|nr:hypothetical protein CRM22_010380 [Opisthorchis felineus]